MILPENLAPLPVSRRDDGSPEVRVPFEDFVSPGDVRQVLLGARAGLEVECLPADDFDSFAGRADILSPRDAPPRTRAGLERELRIPDMALEPRSIHPAFEALPPAWRRPAPPRAQGAMDCEANFGRTRLGDRWWVIGMGVAAAAVLLSGTLVDFIYREAVRHTLPKAAVAPFPGFPKAPASSGEAQAQENEKSSLAATSGEDPGHH